MDRSIEPVDEDPKIFNRLVRRDQNKEFWAIGRYVTFTKKSKVATAFLLRPTAERSGVQALYRSYGC